MRPVGSPDKQKVHSSKLIGCGGQKSDFALVRLSGLPIGCRVSGRDLQGAFQPDVNVVFFNSNISYSVLHGTMISR